MRKRIVQGIGIFFLLSVVNRIVAFFTSSQHQINISDLIYVVLWPYTGYHLIRLRKEGCLLALFIFWGSLGAYILGLIAGIYVAVQNPNHIEPGFVRLSYSAISIWYKLDNWFTSLAVLVFFIAVPILAIFFLSSKETKALFEPNSIEMKKTDAP